LLFARNESTRFISPTKTPEYLAAGKPVISTSIRDVVRPYGELHLVEITDTPDDFIHAAEKILGSSSKEQWLTKVDDFLKEISWDKTWAQMSNLITEVIERKRPERATSLPLDNTSRRASAVATS
jgi:UDP-galactopyranose mutase